MMNLVKMDKSTFILFYVLSVGPLSIALFLYGFFPLINYDNSISTKDDVPKFIENVRIKTDTLYQPMVKRLIIMVIDALRWDFVTGMPVTNSLIANSSACLLQTKVQPPTVTMPRIKAITTGMIPSFIDVALNFGSKPVSGDSVLHQAKEADLKLVFYGDDTWITLFPSIFDRYDGTTSFVVTDFTEVDNNVTRHIHEELYNKTDWSIMIVHYLGLDHIGHVHGPFSPLVKVKLREMDDIIARIRAKVQEWNQNNDPSLFIICGDHGMKDSGGHGGSTLAETTVPFIAIGGECLQSNDRPTEISQIDIVPTLSVILGVPIPHSNIGTIFLDTLYDLPVSKKLFVLYYNAKQVFDHFRRLVDYQNDHAYQKYLGAIKLHNAWLNTKNHPGGMTDDIVLSYKIALRGMKEILINSTVKYDFQIITIAIIFLCQITCISAGKTFFKSPAFKNVISFIVLNIVSWVFMNYYWQSEDPSVLHSMSLISIVIILFIIIVLITNSYLLASINGFNGFERTGTWLLLFGTLAHAISLGGSSFVEEEHQTWYFYSVTVLVLLLYNSISNFFAHSQTNNEKHFHIQILVKLSLLLIGHRILRKLNSTGDKYAHLPDIAGYLLENTLGMTTVLISGLALLTWIDFNHEDKEYRQKSLILSLIAGSCIYLRHMHNHNVVKIPFYPRSRGIYEVQIFWLLLVIHLSYYMYRLALAQKYFKTTFLRLTLHFVVRTWVMVAAVLHQPQNVILLPFQIMFTSVIRETVRDDVKQEMNTFLYAWMGNVFYFYQGNSNSLATVDVAAGYVGMQSYMPFVNGSLMIINTYSAPVLAYLLFIYHTIIQYPRATNETFTQISKSYVTWRFLPVAVYTVIISIQRHHLFVWSVFSPKLLYEAVYTAVLCLIVFCVTVVILKMIIKCGR